MAVKRNTNDTLLLEAVGASVYKTQTYYGITRMYSNFQNIAAGCVSIISQNKKVLILQ